MSWLEKINFREPNQLIYPDNQILQDTDHIPCLGSQPACLDEISTSSLSTAVVFQHKLEK